MGDRGAPVVSIVLRAVLTVYWVRRRWMEELGRWKEAAVVRARDIEKEVSCGWEERGEILFGRIRRN